MSFISVINGRPGRRRRLAGAVAAAAVACVLVAAGGGVAFAAAAGHQARAGSVSALAAGRTGMRAAVPWRRVGAGWVLAEYWNGRNAVEGKPVAAPAILYLVDPAGGRYQLYRTAAATSAPALVGWSGDKRRALLQAGAAGQLEQVTLTTGRVSGLFRLAGGSSVIGYTRPDGLNLLGSRQVGARMQLDRFSLTGALAKVLNTSAPRAVYGGEGVYSASGTTLAAGASRGLQLVSNAGGVIRALPASGTACSAARWWNASTIVASCASAGVNRLWLVPAGGGRARALTPERGETDGDLGDLDAWSLPSGLYLQSAGPCGVLQIFRQRANGSITLVTVPHSSNNNRLLTADGSALLVESPNGCGAGANLLWFNPGTRHVTTLFSAGVVAAVPYGDPS